MSGSEFRPTVETAPEELKLAIHLRGQAHPRRWTRGCKPSEAISIANRSSLSNSHTRCR